MIKKILFGTEKMTRTDNKITLFNIRLNLNASKNLSADQLHALSHIVTFFILFKLFGSKLKLLNFVNIWMVEDNPWVQILDSVTWGIFQLYFYDNLFNPNENRRIQDKTKFNKKTIETLLNKLFVLDNPD